MEQDSEFEEQGAAHLLQGLRVLDLTLGRAEMTSRFLADLGAEVIRAAVPGRDAEDGREAAFGALSLHHLTHNANKYQSRLDLSAPAGRAEMATLLARRRPTGRGHRAGYSRRLWARP